MPPSRLDSVYRRLLITKFFTKGWGKPENLQRLFEFRKILSNREECIKLIPRDYPVKITKEEIWSDCRVFEGHFITPLDKYLPGLVPEAAKLAHFQILLPLKWKENHFKPMCLHLAGTGDHYFWRRRNIMAKPLLKEAGIGAIILENPFYGLRKPKDQVRSCLHNVTDIFVMGGCLVLESLVLFHWCERNGLGPLGVTGLSMGGHMASLAATNWPKPIVLVPCLSWSTASSVFTRGVMSQSINWELLESQYLSDGIYKDKLSKMVTIVDDAFLAGKRFVKNFSQSMRELKQDMQQHMDNVTSSKDLKLSVIKDIDEKCDVQVKKVNTTIHNGPVEINSSNVIAEELINKITSDAKFELNSQEISAINKMNSAETQPSNEQTASDTTGYRYSINPSEIHNYESNYCSEPNTVKFSTNCTVEVLEQTCENSIDTTMNEGMKKYMGALLWKDSDIMNLDVNKISWRQREAMQFMRGVMDECTHLSNFSIPFDTSLIIAVCAKDDAYVPRENCGNLEDIWPGAEIRYVNAGHVSAYVLHQGLFRSSIIEAFERYKQKWTQDKS